MTGGGRLLQHDYTDAALPDTELVHGRVARRQVHYRILRAAENLAVEMQHRSRIVGDDDYVDRGVGQFDHIFPIYIG